MTGAFYRGLERLGKCFALDRPLEEATPPAWAWLSRGIVLASLLLGLSGAVYRERSGPPAGMVCIPAGVFRMGMPSRGAPQPVFRSAWLPTYYLDRTEVTVDAYALFVQATGYKAPYVPEAWAGPFNWMNGKPPRGVGRHPVTLVSWYDARAYCRWAGKRLPTDAEWEKGARGTDGRRFPWGNQWDGQACNHGKGGWDNYDGSDGYELTSPVGRYPAGRSPYGLDDMYGNAWEWVDDWYPLTWDFVQAEARGEVLVSPRGPAIGPNRVARGGSYFFDLAHDWSRERAFMLPGERRKSTGFRCAWNE